MEGSCESNTDALIQRIAANREAEHNLEEWIFRHVKIDSVANVLDLGCGTGKQLFALKELVAPQSQLVGIDVSEAAVCEVMKQAEGKGIENVRAEQCDLDDVVSKFEGVNFDLVLSTYAIYYSADMAALISSIVKLLKDGGQVFVCGNGRGTNDEFTELLHRIGAQDIEPVGDFISARTIAEIGQQYSNHEVDRLANSVDFATAEAVMSWWTNHGSYVAELEQGVQAQLEAHFRKSQSFRMTKNVLGIRYEN